MTSEPAQRATHAAHAIRAATKKSRNRHTRPVPTVRWVDTVTPLHQQVSGHVPAPWLGEHAGGSEQERNNAAVKG